MAMLVYQRVNHIKSQNKSHESPKFPEKKCCSSATEVFQQLDFQKVLSGEVAGDRWLSAGDFTWGWIGMGYSWMIVG